MTLSLSRLALAGMVSLLLAACDRTPATTGNQASDPHVEAQPAVQIAALPVTTARVQTASDMVALSLEVASNAAEQQQGLAGRAKLPQGTGMLFPFSPPRTPNFWMKDTAIPLDLLFIRTDGTIAAILPGKPGDLTPISSGEPASAVIEIGGGEAARHGIAIGDKVTWGDCGASGDTQPARFCPR